MQLCKSKYNLSIAQTEVLAPNVYFELLTVYFSVLISCLIIAAKFYCETEDVVVNADIARFLSGGNLIADFEWLNSLEEQILSFLDFDLYVSLLDFNRISS